MKIIYDYSHFGGSEILEIRHPQISQEIHDVIFYKQAELEIVTNEKLYQISGLPNLLDLANEFSMKFQNKGFRVFGEFSNNRFVNNFGNSTGVVNQIAFIKKPVLVNIQLSSYENLLSDMAKFQYFFNESHADVGVEIVPCHRLHTKMSSGVSYGEQLVYDIERLKRHFPAVSVKIIFIDVDDDE